MLEMIQKDWRTKVALTLFICFSLWWSYLNTFIDKADTDAYQYFGATYGLLALFGGVSGIVIAKNWGGMSSYMGKAILMFSFGLCAQEFGQLVYSAYYFLFKVEVPYPSIGDLGYFGSIPLYIAGVWYLAKASGVNIGLKSAKGKLSAIMFPLVMLSLSYAFFLNGYQFEGADPLTVFLDFGYPLGQAIYISLAVLTYLLSRGVLGGVMRTKIIFILFALVIQYLADYTFLFSAMQGTVYAGGMTDYIYLTAYLIMSLALFKLDVTYYKLQQRFAEKRNTA